MHFPGLPRSTIIFIQYVCRCLTLILVLLCPLSAAALDKVRLQLKWQPQFQFAGYYAAEAQGYYKKAGLDVEIIASQPGKDPVQQVLQGEAEFGVGTTDLLLLRERGAPVVVLSVIFQHSSLALLTLKHDGLQSIHDLSGSRVMIEPGSSELYAYLRKEGISANDFTLLPHGYHVKDLLTGNVDAMSTYVTDEPFELISAGKEYLLYFPRSSGIDFYGDNLFTTESQIRKKPERVKAFREASLKGWEYAMSHTEEVIQLIYTRYSKRHSLEHLRFEARQMTQLLQTDLVKIGHMHPGRWQHIAETYAELGMMETGFDFEGFLYKPDSSPRNLRWLFALVGVTTLMLIFLSTLSIYIYRINARLRQDAAERKKAEEQIQELVRQLEIEKDYAEKTAMTDSLTELPNRRCFDETLLAEFYRSKRSGAPLSLIMIDVDHFKKFNDNFGHLAGDECLRRVGTVIRGIVMRAPDFAARFGGEEFVALLPETDRPGSAIVAEQIRKGVEELALPDPVTNTVKRVTVSLGVVTVFTAGVSSPEEIVSLADEALYFAKEGGRNRVEVRIYDSGPDNNLLASRSRFVQLVWQVSYECGNATIDEQHRNLFETANKLLSAVISRLPKHKCVELINSLLADIINHFNTEEAIFTAAEFPYSEDHYRCHSDLVVRATALAEKYESDELSLGELFSFIAYDVVAQHIFTEDRKYIPYIVNKID